jgi:hypothetical protein
MAGNATSKLPNRESLMRFKLLKWIRSGNWLKSEACSAPVKRAVFFKGGTTPFGDGS